MGGWDTHFRCSVCHCKSGCVKWSRIETGPDWQLTPPSKHSDRLNLSGNIAKRSASRAMSITARKNNREHTQTVFRPISSHRF